MFEQKTNAGTPCRTDVDGRYQSAITRDTFETLDEVEAADGGEYRLRCRAAGRKVTLRELDKGGTDVFPIQDVYQLVTPDKPLTEAQGKRLAADHLREQIETEKMTPKEKLLRISEANAAAAEAAEEAAKEREELLAREDVQEAIAKARLLQTRHGYVADKRQTTLNDCRECVELAMTGKFAEFKTLHDKLHQQLSDAVNVEAAEREAQGQLRGARETAELLGKVETPKRQLTSADFPPGTLQLNGMAI